MKTDRISPDGREVYEFWTWSENFKLNKVEAWKNKANEAFWVPSCGFTTTFGNSLFETKTEAYCSALAVIARLKQTIARNEQNLEASLTDNDEGVK